jgi:hypothetical protein
MGECPGKCLKDEGCAEGCAGGCAKECPGRQSPERETPGELGSRCLPVNIKFKGRL